MDKKSTTFSLSPKQVVDLLKIGSDMRPSTADSKQGKAELLHNRLSETFPISPSTSRKLTKKLSQIRRTIDALAGESIGKLLQDPKTDITIIRMIKDYGRKLSERAESETEHHVANTLYYAAIAHALIFHKLMITKFSYEDLEQSFDRLSKESWIPENLLGLFAEASTYCRSRVK